MSNETYIRHAEAKEDAERLSRNLNRDVEAVHKDCDCDHDKSCGKCGGQNFFYVLRYAFCNHVFIDGDQSECEAGDCRHREYLEAIKRDEQRETMEAANAY